MKLEFWFDFASTYSYLAALRIEKATKDGKIELAWKPFLLGPIFKLQGWGNSPFNVYPAKGRYMWRDMERLCLFYNIPFGKPTEFPRNGLLAARIACRHSQEPWLPDFVRSVYIANFEKDLDISQPDVIQSCLSLSSSEAAMIISDANSIESKTLLKNNTDMAISLGIFGAPTFMAGNEMFWGADRLDAAIDWAEKI